MNLGSAYATIDLINSGFMNKLAETERAMDRLGSSGSKGVDGFSNKVQNLSGEITTVGAGIAGLGAVIAVPFVSGVNAAVDFESAMASVQAVSQSTGEEFEALSELALQIGADTAFSATEAASAIEELSKAGVGVEDILNGAADGATALAAAAGTDLPNAATAIANALNIFSLSGEEATRVANVFAAAANKSATDLEQLQRGLAQGGAQFAMYGLSVEESIALLAMFADYGIRGSDAATSLNAAIRTMASGVGVSNDAMQELNISLYDSTGQFVGFDGVAAQLQQTLGGLTEEQRNLYLTQLGGADGMRALNILYEQGAAGVNEYTAAVTGTDAASSAAAIRMDTVAGSVEALGGSLETLGIVFMDRLLPGIKFAADRVTGFTNVMIRLPGPIQTGIVAISGMVGGLSLLGGGFLLVLPRIIEFRTALAAIGGMRGGLSLLGGGMRSLLGAINPVGAALIGLSAAGLYAWSKLREGKEAAQALEDALVSLGDVATNLRLGHRDAEADFLTDFTKDAQQIIDMAPQLQDAMLAGFGEEARFHINEVRDAYDRNEKELEQYAAAVYKIGEMFSDSRIDAAALNNELNTLENQYRTGEITLDQYDDALIAITQDQAAFRLSTEEATAASEDNAAAMALQAADADKLADAMQELLDRLMAVSGMDNPLAQFDLSGQVTEAGHLAYKITEVGTALDTVFRTVVGNTNAIAQQASGVNDWATELINVAGEYGKIDDLKKQGYIDQIQYNAAQRAQGEIAAANAHIQNDVLTIQAMQAPLIAEHTQALEAQMHTLSGLGAEQQLIALGWMDTATAARAMEFQALAVAVANGEMGASGERAFAEMISGAAAVDPVLSAVLEDMGLITAHPDGTFTVHLEGAEAAMSDLDRLNVTIGNLIDVLDDGLLNQTYTVDVETGDTAARVTTVAEALKSLSAAYEKLPKTQATPYTGDGTGGATNIPRQLPKEGDPYPTIRALPSAGMGSGAPDPKPYEDVAAAVRTMTTALDSGRFSLAGFGMVLSDLNAAFPTLTASMTTFNSGPLTTLNAGFPILGATVLAFNSGPLTTLNAAFPILTASMTAFNAGPLTTLNAGFPILAATILAFNAGPLTTLNAAFPILTASMVAFNLLGLTVLNAGFPLLGATILAFNAGPLTTLNAAFPILVASMAMLDTAMVTSGANVTTFGGTVTTMSTDVSAGFADMASAAETNMATLVGAVEGGMADASGAISSEAGTWPGLISALEGDMFDAGSGAGAAASEGVAAGIRSALGEAQAAAGELADVVASTMAMRLLISSPSRVISRLMERGVGPGAVEGILAGIPGVMRASSVLASAAMPDLTRRPPSGVFTESANWTFLGREGFRTDTGLLVKPLGQMVGAWEKMTHGYWRNVRNDHIGIIKGIRTVSLTDALDRQLATRRYVADRRGQQSSAATRAANRPTATHRGGISNVYHITHTYRNDIDIHQQPGQSAEDVADVVITRIVKAETSVMGR